MLPNHATKARGGQCRSLRGGAAAPGPLPSPVWPSPCDLIREGKPEPIRAATAADDGQGGRRPGNLQATVRSGGRSSRAALPARRSALSKSSTWMNSIAALRALHSSSPSAAVSTPSATASATWSA